MSEEKTATEGLDYSKLRGRARIRSRCACGAGFDMSGESGPVFKASDEWIAAHRGEGHRFLLPGERRPRKRLS